MTPEVKQYIAQQEDQIAQIEKKRPALEKLAGAFAILAQPDVYGQLLYNLHKAYPQVVTEVLCDTLDSIVSQMAEGYAQLYGEELATMDEIKRRFEATRKQLESPISLATHMQPGRKQ